MENDFGHWLAGFIDGEGCFFISRYERRNGPGFCPAFLLRLRADDRAILEEIVRTTGIGKLTWERRESGSPSTRPNTSPALGWRVVAKADIRALIEILDRHPLRSKKARDYAIWREAVMYWIATPSTGFARGLGESRDWGPVAALREQLMALRRYDSVAAAPPA